MNYKECLKTLKKIENNSYNLDLANIKSLTKKLGNPQNKYKTIHVAGTNGKGSVCAILSAALKPSYNVGLYTSPHLKKINERIRIDDQDISDDDFAEFRRGWPPSPQACWFAQNP